MRSLKPNSEYFAFLDALRDGGAVNTVLAASYLVWELLGLRAEEARAICADWRATVIVESTLPELYRGMVERLLGNPELLLK